MHLKTLLIMTLVVTSFALTACGTTGKRVENHALTTDVSGLVRDHSADPTVLLRRPHAPSFSSYYSFIIDPVRIDYRDPSFKELDSKDVAQMQRYFQKAVSKKLKDAGYRITTQPSARTMRISFVLSGLKAPNAAANIVGVLAPIAISVGKVTVEASFRDATTGRIDAVVISTSQGSRVLNTSPWSTWSDIEGAFDMWAEGIAEAVKKSHNEKH